MKLNMSERMEKMQIIDRSIHEKMGEKCSCPDSEYSDCMCELSVLGAIILHLTDSRHAVVTLYYA